MSNSKDLRARLILLRHGQSLWNKEKRLAGQADVSISNLGRRQILQLHEIMRTLQPLTVTSSDLRRARESATLLGYETPRIDHRLREANLGKWEGEYIANLQEEEYRAWRAGSYTPPGGETWAAFCDRVEEVLTELIYSGGSHLCITHGGVVRAACARLLGLRSHRIVPVSPASITVVDVYGQPRLSVYNLSPDCSLDRFI